MDLAYLVYLNVYTGNSLETLTPEERGSLIAANDSHSDRWRVRCACALAVGDRSRDHGPRSLTEVTREVERMLAPEPASTGEAPEDAPKDGDTWEHVPTLTSWKVLQVYATPEERQRGVYRCEGRSHDAAPKRQEIYIAVPSRSWRLVKRPGEP